MEWRLRKSSHGGFVAEYGKEHKGGVQTGFAGVTLPTFMAYVSVQFSSKKEAETYIKNNPYPMGRVFVF